MMSAVKTRNSPEPRGRMRQAAWPGMRSPSQRSSGRDNYNVECDVVITYGIGCGYIRDWVRIALFGLIRFSILKWFLRRAGGNDWAGFALSGPAYARLPGTCIGQGALAKLDPCQAALCSPGETGKTSVRERGGQYE